MRGQPDGSGRPTRGAHARRRPSRTAAGATGSAPADRAGAIGQRPGRGRPRCAGRADPPSGRGLRPRGPSRGRRALAGRRGDGRARATPGQSPAPRRARGRARRRKPAGPAAHARALGRCPRTTSSARSSQSRQSRMKGDPARSTASGSGCARYADGARFRRTSLRSPARCGSRGRGAPARGSRPRPRCTASRRRGRGSRTSRRAACPR